jgi:hypothetical protein
MYFSIFQLMTAFDFHVAKCLQLCPEMSFSQFYWALEQKLIQQKVFSVNTQKKIVIHIQ